MLKIIPADINITMEAADDEPFQLIEHSIIEQYEPGEIGFPSVELEMSDMPSISGHIDSSNKSLDTLSEDLTEKTMYGYLGDIDHELISGETKKYARIILMEAKYEAATVKFVPPDFKVPRDHILTNEIILSHVAVVREVFRMMSVDPSPRYVVTYVCKSLDHAGVSALAGSVWHTMDYSDQVTIVLTIARIVADQLWCDFDDSIYAEFHGHLDRQAFFYVKELRTNRIGPAGCCTII